MRKDRRLHLAAYQLVAHFLPPEHRQRHLADQIQLFDDLLRTGTPARRLWLNAAADLILVHRQQTTSQRRTLMSLAARLALVPLSLLNVGAGIAVAAIALATSAIPVWVTAPAAAICAQGLFTLLLISGRLRNLGAMAGGLFVLGEAGTLALGAVGLTAAISTQTVSHDPEYGPLTLLTIVVVHAVVGLAAALVTPNDHLIKAN